MSSGEFSEPVDRKGASNVYRIEAVPRLPPINLTPLWYRHYPEGRGFLCTYLGCFVLGPPETEVEESDDGRYFVEAAEPGLCLEWTEEDGTHYELNEPRVGVFEIQKIT